MTDAAAKPKHCPGRYNGADGRCVYCRAPVKRQCQLAAIARQHYGDPCRGSTHARSQEVAP
jgi:hypothetical protein